MNHSPEFRPFTPGATGETETKRGHNIRIRNFWVRHSQKASGEVFNASKSGISASSLSEGGVQRAHERGQTISSLPDGAKGYKSSSARTQETFDALMEGYQQTNPEAAVRENVHVREELIAPAGTKEWIAEYEAKWSANKQRLLQEGIADGRYPDTKFSSLTPNQQEEIAEAAEEPVIREWVDNPESTMAKEFPPRLQAAHFAVLFDRRGSRMAEKLDNDSQIDLFHNMHKTVTEPFLASGVLIRESDGKRITKLEDIGGSLKVLDQWESETSTDENGTPAVVISLRGQTYRLDTAEYQKLVAEGQAAWKDHLEQTANEQ